MSQVLDRFITVIYHPGTHGAADFEVSVFKKAGEVSVRYICLHILR